MIEYLKLKIKKNADSDRLQCQCQEYQAINLRFDTFFINGLIVCLTITFLGGFSVAWTPSYSKIDCVTFTYLRLYQLMVMIVDLFESLVLIVPSFKIWLLNY